MDPDFKNSQPTEKPSAPPVPRELLSARPAMTRVVPKMPDHLKAASQATAEPEPKQPTPEELADRQERIDYLKNVRQQKQKPHRSKKWLIVAIVLLLVVIAGLAVAYFVLNKKSEPAAPTATSNVATTDTSQTPEATTPEATTPAELKDYTSSDFNLGFKYPSDWTVDESTKAITVTSPVETLPGADGQDEMGAVVLTIQPKQKTIPAFKSGNAVAVLDSKKVKYSQPAAGQRANTYITYAQYSTTTTKGALDAMFITGNYGYKRPQTILESDVTKIDPLVTVSFVGCDKAPCDPAAQATQLSGETFTGSELYTTVENMLTSLAIN